MLHERYKKASSLPSIDLDAAEESSIFTSSLFMIEKPIWMFYRILYRNVAGIALMGLALGFLQACSRFPEPDFTWGPEDNPEAGDVIWFANRTPEASFFEWHFGDQIRSDLENPTHIFTEPGDYDVELTAYGDAGSRIKTKTVTINDPTVLAFTITDSTASIPLPGTELRIYDNEVDWDNVNEPLLIGYANSEGKVEFSNLESTVYYLWAYLDEPEGYWISGGYTPALTLNEINSFLIPCQWFLHGEKKSGPLFSVSGHKLRELP
jgi:hypothetical protein